MNVTIVLPSLNPDEKILAVTTALLGAGFSEILVINDGSRPDCLHFFDEIARHPQCTVLTHEVNRGKGRALKTAFTYLLERDDDSIGVVTVDGDNQHHIDDITALAQALEADDSAMILGVRNFDLPQVPPKSRLGNKLTSLAFAAVCGIRISDTQTGLRAIPRRALAPLCALEGERFEYETNMLLAARRLGLPIRERTIQTIYIDENATSHYRPLLDSLKILRLILKFVASSLSCAAVDVGSYWLIFRLLAGQTLKAQVFWGTVISRVISSVCNYLLNRRAVFQSAARLERSLPRYYALCVVQMLVSYLLVYLLTAAFGGASTLIKLVVDSLLFFLSFGIQRDWVFRQENK